MKKFGSGSVNAWRRAREQPGGEVVAWLQCEADGSRRLLINSPPVADAISLGPPIRLGVFEAGARVLGWGEAGIWVSVPQDPASPRLVLVDEAGWPEQVPYWGTVTLSADGSRVLLGQEVRRRWTFAGAGPGPDSPLVFDWAPRHPRAQRNPYGDRTAPFAAWGNGAAADRLAFIGFGWEGGTAYWLEIWDADEAARVDRVIVEFEPHRVGWDPGGRHVLMPGTLRREAVSDCILRVFSGLFAYDVEEGRLSALDLGLCGIRYVAVVPG